MKEENKKLLSIFVVVIVVAAAIATAVTFGMKYLEKEEKEEQPMFAKIFVDESSGTIPFAVNFTTLILYYEGDITYEWDFGDGETSEEINPLHTYEETDIYTCTLEVTDSSGKKSLDSVEILVKRNKPPVVIISINENILQRKFIPILSSLPLWPGDVQKIVNILESINPLMLGEGRIVCTAQVNDPEDDEIVSYEWAHIVEIQLSKYLEPEQPIHHFEGNKSIRLPEMYTWPGGTHIVKLTVEDSAGNKANASIEFLVEQSQKKINRDNKFRLFTNTLNTWVDFGNPFLGPIVAGLLLTFWKYSNFTGIKLATVLVLTFLFQLDMGNALLIQAKQFLDEHPRMMNAVDNSLVDIQDRLDKNRDKFSSDFVNNTIDSIEVIREQLGLANKRPVISDPFPEDGAKNIPVDCSYVYIDVNDSEGDPFNITISGDYVNDITYTNQYNGTFNATLITPLPEKEEIFWNVEVVDPRGKVVTGEYKFTTFVEL